MKQGPVLSSDATVVNGVQSRTAPPLDGIKVADFTQFLSGPYCTQMLGDLGAEIIKVESPQGDLSRSMPPHFIGGDSLYHISINRNKQSIAVDMKTPAGTALVQRLVERCDIVVENYRPGVMERLGISAAALRAARPSLIWCSISGFGQDGPYRDKPAYDMIVQALSGGMSLTGEPGRQAVRAGIPIGDLGAGMYASTAILAALHRRSVTGRGDFIDISMLDCQVAMLCYQAAYYLHSGQVPGRQGSRHDSIPTYRTFATQDGTEIVVTANTERMWQGLCGVLGLPGLADKPEFKTNRERHENRLVLWPILEAAFLARPSSEWVPLLERENIPAAVVNTLDRVLSDPQVQHRKMVLSMTGADGRTARAVGSPMVFAESEAPPASFPPGLGENATSIMREILGMSDSDIEELLRLGVVTSSEPGGG